MEATETMSNSPYHEAEILVQRRSGRRDFAEALAPRIFSRLSPEAIDLFTAVPFIIVGSLDEAGHPWASILSGPPGFVSVANEDLTIDARPASDDPLLSTVIKGGDIGLLAIDFARRTRYRVNGKVSLSATRLLVDVKQCYRNCPQYIHARSADYKEHSPGLKEGLPARRLSALDDHAFSIVSNAETFFIATHGSGSPCDDPRLGADVSHRGGNAGFVEVHSDRKHLAFPDYIGNFMFNTLGNLTRYPRCGLLFIDFATGQTVQVTGTASVEWDIERIGFTPGAQRMIEIEIDEVIVAPATGHLTWSFIEHAPDLLRYRTLQLDAAAQADHEPNVAPEGFRKYTVSRVVDEADDIRSLYLRPVEGSTSAHRPGQHVQVCCTLPAGNALAIRHYSLSDYGLDHNEYRIGVRKNPDDMSRSVSRHIHETIRPGSVMLVSEPRGEFVLDTSAENPVALVSAGVGVTPMLCMLKALAKENPNRPVWFIHGARNGAEHAYASEVRRLTDRSANAHAHFRYTRPRTVDLMGRDHDSEGRVDTELIKSLIPLDSDVYICGPDTFMSDVRDGLKQWGIPGERIHIESFGGGSQVGSVENVGMVDAEVRLVGTEILCRWKPDSGSLLNLLEKAGVAVAYSCRAGMCGSCEQTLVSGHVRYVSQPSYPVAPGRVLLCCAQPASDVTISIR